MKRKKKKQKTTKREKTMELTLKILFFQRIRLVLVCGIVSTTWRSFYEKCWTVFHQWAGSSSLLNLFWFQWAITPMYKQWCAHSQNVCIRYTKTSLLNPGKSKLMVSLPLVDLSPNMMACWLKFCKMHISWLFNMLIMNDSTSYSADG